MQADRQTHRVFKNLDNNSVAISMRSKLSHFPSLLIFQGGDARDMKNYCGGSCKEKRLGHSRIGF